MSDWFSETELRAFNISMVTKTEEGHCHWVGVAKDGTSPLARLHEVKLLGVNSALHEVSQLPVAHLGSVRSIQEPPAEINSLLIFKKIRKYLEAMTVATPT